MKTQLPDSGTSGPNRHASQKTEDPKRVMVTAGHDSKEPTVLTSTPQQKTRRRVSASSLLRLIQLVRPYRIDFTVGMIALLIGSGVNLVFPEVARRVLAPDVFPLVLEHLPLLTAGLAALFILQGGAFYVRSYLFGKIGHNVVANVRAQLFDSIIRSELSVFDQGRSGDLVSRLNSDAALVQDAVSIKLSVLLRYGIQVVLGVVLMTWMSWKMTVAIVLSVVSMIIVSGAFVRKLRAASRDYQAGLGALAAFAGECITGIRVIRSLGAEEEVGQGFNNLNTATKSTGLRRSTVSAAFSSGASLLLNLLLLLVQWYGIRLVVSQELPLNDLAAFVIYGAIVAVSFAFLVSTYAELMQSMGGLERVFEFLQVHPSDTGVRNSNSAQPLPATNNSLAEGPRIRFEGVSFAYPQRADVEILHGVSFMCQPGKVTALVGPSGAGKSSIVQLLLRFYSARDGTLFLNEQNLSELTTAELRRQIAWVPQDPQLFGFSVLQNLTMGNPNLSREEVQRAITEWPFLSFVSELEQGLDTILGERGAQLSGGQRQRLAIARAVLRRPPILILDEATSGLDSQSEESVTRVIRSVLPRSTVLVISHRLATVRMADAVYVIEDGRIIQEGTHESLRSAPGLYQQYVERQALG